MSQQNKRELPAVIEAKLAAIRRRERNLTLVQGMLTTAVVLLVGMLLAMLVDYFAALLSPGARATLTLCAIGAAGIALLMSAILPLVRGQSMSTTAREVDGSVPALEERWTTVVEVSQSKDAPAVRGSEAMLDRVAQEAETMSTLVNDRQVVRPVRVKYWSGALGGVLAVLIIVFLSNPQTMSVLLQRFWAPAGDVSLTRITSVTGDKQVARHEALAIEANISGRARESISLVMRTDKGEQTVALRAPTQLPAHVQHVVKDVGETFEYRLVSGDGQTPWHKVTAVDRPNIAGIKFRIIPPTYTKLPPQESETLPRVTRAIEGSRLELEILPDQPVATVELSANKASLSMKPAQGQWYRYEGELHERMQFAVSMRKADSVGNDPKPECEINVYPDLAPTVDITTPESHISAPSDEPVKVEFTAKDDFGVRSVELVTKVQDADGKTREEVKPIELPAAHVDQKTVKGITSIDLKAMGLKQGDRLTYAVRATDNRNVTGSSDQKREGDEQQANAQNRDGQEQQNGQHRDGRDQQANAGQPRDQQNARPTTNPAAGEQRAGENGQQQAGSPTTQPAMANATQGQPREGEAPAEPRDQQNAQAGSQEASNQQNGSQSPSGQQQANSQQQQQDQADQQQAQSQQQQQGQSDQQQQAQSDPSDPSNQQARAGQQNPTTNPSTPPPPNEMTMRKAPPGAQAQGQSKQQSIQVDEWAGSQEVQRRRKLQLAIEAYLKRIEAALARAHKNADGLLTLARTEANWGDEQNKSNVAAREDIADIETAVAELSAKSKGTVYAYIGMQFLDIGISHVTPAGEQLARASKLIDDRPKQTESLEKAVYHLARARQLLSDLTKQYEEVKRETEFADAMQRVAKMHQLFVEDTFAFMASMKPAINERDPLKMQEVDEKLVEKIKEREEKLKKVMAELSKILSEDPELMKRLMAVTRMESVTLRDQLTLLARRQAVAHHLLNEWVQADDAGKEKLKKTLFEHYAKQREELVKQAALLAENMVTWAPKDLGEAADGVKKMQSAAQQAALQSVNIQRLTTPEKIEEALANQQKLIDAFSTMKDELAALNNAAAANDNLSYFLVERTANVSQLLVLESGWTIKMRSLKENDFAPAARAEQIEVMNDTTILAEKMDQFAAMVSGSPEVVGKAEAVANKMAEVVEKQVDAAGELAMNRLPPGRDGEAKAVAAFAEAEKLFDEMLTAIEKEMEKGGPPKNVKPAPELEDLLAMLERECNVCEKLGLAAMPINVQMMTDWMLDQAMQGQGAGAGAGAGQGQGQGQGRGQGRNGGNQAMQAANAAARAGQAGGQAARNARDAANDRARRAAAMRTVPQPQPGQLARPGAAPNESGRDWDTLVSKLQKDLQQSREGNPPEQYREAIDQYLRSIAKEGKEQE